jgi:hypothetical protein
MSKLRRDLLLFAPNVDPQWDETPTSNMIARTNGLRKIDEETGHRLGWTIVRWESQYCWCRNRLQFRSRSIRSTYPPTTSVARLESLIGGPDREVMAFLSSSSFGPR